MIPLHMGLCFPLKPTLTASHQQGHGRQPEILNLWLWEKQEYENIPPEMLFPWQLTLQRSPTPMVLGLRAWQLTSTVECVLSLPFLCSTGSGMPHSAPGKASSSASNGTATRELHASEQKIVWVFWKTRDGSSLFRIQQQTASSSAASSAACPWGPSRELQLFPFRDQSSCLTGKGQFRARSSKSLWYPDKSLRLSALSSWEQQKPSRIHV